jgi:hypothetical protein
LCNPEFVMVGVDERHGYLCEQSSDGAKKAEALLMESQQYSGLLRI